MKLKLLIAALVLSTCSLSAYAAPTDGTNNQAASTQALIDQSTTTQAAGSTTPSANPQRDGEILAFLVVVNKNEIAAANAALNRKVSPAIKKYAQMLDKEHSKNLQDTLKVSQKIGEQPVDTNETSQLKDKGQKDLSDLNAMNNQQFQAAFLDAMVKGHTEVLAKLDEFINETNNPQLKKHLEATRAHVAKHLAKAKDLQRNGASNS